MYKYALITTLLSVTLATEFSGILFAWVLATSSPLILQLFFLLSLLFFTVLLINGRQLVWTGGSS